MSGIITTFVSTKNKRDMEKIWLRLGGNITCTPEERELIMGGDTDTLVKVIKEHGVELDGETYEPESEVEFDLNPMTLTFFR